MIRYLVGFMLLASTGHAQLYEADPVLSRPAPEIAPADPNFHPLACGDANVLTIVRNHLNADLDTATVREMGRANQHALCAVNRGSTAAQEQYVIDTSDGTAIVYMLSHAVAGQIVVDFSPPVLSLSLGIERRVP